MWSVNVAYDHNIPQYASNACSHCKSAIGESLCHTKHRGCCWYFPKFTLYDIHRMTKIIDGLQSLHMIIEQPHTVIHPYHIHALGSFQEADYNAYMDKGEFIHQDSINDQSIFFKTCCFFKAGYGCQLPPRFRTYICSFFLCDEIIHHPSLKDKIEPYMVERMRYVKWVEWENNALLHLLREKQINLKDHFHDVLQILQNLPLDTYEFPALEPLSICNEWDKGA